MQALATSIGAAGRGQDWKISSAAGGLGGINAAHWPCSQPYKSPQLHVCLLVTIFLPVRSVALDAGAVARRWHHAAETNCRHGAACDELSRWRNQPTRPTHHRVDQGRVSHARATTGDETRPLLAVGGCNQKYKPTHERICKPKACEEPHKASDLAVMKAHARYQEGGETFLPRSCVVPST